MASQNLSMLPVLTVRSTRYDSVDFNKSNTSSLAIMMIWLVLDYKVTKNP